MYEIKQTNGTWRLYYVKPEKGRCFEGGLVFPMRVSWDEKWKLERYLERVNART